jgi:hypothetical protein
MATTCYMCDALATGNEHVPPRCLFPEAKDIGGIDLRKNLISVPSCDLHNTTKSKEDEYLLFILVSHFENNRIAASQFVSKILRAIDRRPYLRSIYLNDETGHGSVDGRPTFAVKVDTIRFGREIDHITRGLCFHEFRRRWTEQISIYCLSTFVVEKSTGRLGNRRCQEMAACAANTFAGMPRKGDNPDVFWYQIHAEPDKNALVVRMCFYQGFEVIALSLPS